MDGALGVHRMKKSHVINTFAQTWEQVGNHFSALTTRLEVPFWPHDPASSTLPLSSEGWDIDCFTVQTVQLGLVVKRVDLAGAPVHKKEDHTPCLGRTGEETTLKISRDIWRKAVGRLSLTSDPCVTEEVRQGDARKSTTGLPQELPAGSATEM